MPNYAVQRVRHGRARERGIILFGKVSVAWSESGN